MQKDTSPTAHHTPIRWQFLTTLILTLLFTVHFAYGAETEWRVGLSSVVITPSEPMVMSGYASRKGVFTGVIQDIQAKAMALEDAEGNRALLITADLIGFTNDLSERICARILERTGLPREAILLNASHTHAGPSVRPNSSIAAESPPEPVEKYMDELVRKITGIAAEAVSGMQPASLSWSHGITNIMTNRREFTENGIILGHNPRGLVDRTVPVLRVDGADGKVQAVLFGAACHCTTLTGKNMEICGDYAGFAQSGVEERYPGVQAMFMAGCGGDANPYPRSTLEDAKMHGAALAEEVARVLETPLKPLAGPLRTAFARVDLPLQRFASKEDLAHVGEESRSYRRFFIEGAEKRFEEEGRLPETYNAPFAVWQFGSGLTLVGFSGETLVDYVTFTERALGPLNLWISGYCNDVFGYLPSARVLAEGGYETRGLYVDVGLFAPEVEDVVMDTIKDLARRVGRPMPGEER